MLLTARPGSRSDIPATASKVQKADIESIAYCHLGNIFLRIGCKPHINPWFESTAGDLKAYCMLTREYLAMCILTARRFLGK